MVLAAADDPAFLELAALFEDSKTAEPNTSAALDAEVDANFQSSQTERFVSDEVFRLKAYRESSQKTNTVHPSPISTSKPRTLLSSEQKERIGQLNEEVFEEEERRRIEEERKRREEEERKRREEELRRQEEERRREHERRLQQQLNDVLNKFRGETFSSNQEARRFYMSIIAGLPEELVKIITNRGMGWRCNAYDSVHDSPSDCADPSRGGVWLIR